MVGSQHKDHLDELGGPWGQAALEPQQAKNTANTNILLEDVRDTHAGVQQLLAALVGDGGNERSRLADEAKFL